MENIMLLGFGTQAVEFIKVIKGKGYYLSAADLQNYYENMDIDLKSMIDNFEEYKDFEKESFYEVALKAHKHKNLKAIIPLADGHVLPAALIQEKLQLKGPGLHAALISINKAMQRQLFKSMNFPIPNFKQLTSEKDTDALKHADYPLVLKPVNMFGSIGVKIVENYNEAIKHVAMLKQYSNVILAEEYIDGEEISIESVVQNNEIKFTNITLKKLGEKPLFVEKGHVVPYPNLNNQIKEKILEVNSKVIQALAVKDSLVHLEAKIRNEQVIIIEVAVRMPGDRIMELIEYSTGINMYEAYVDILTGNEPNLTKKRDRISAVNWFTADTSGILQSIEIPEEINNKQDLRMLEFLKKELDEVKVMESSFDRLGFCIVEGEKYEDLENSILDIESKINFKIK